VNGPNVEIDVMFELARSMVTITSTSSIAGLQKIAADSTGSYAKNQKTTGWNSKGVVALFEQLDGKTSAKELCVNNGSSGHILVNISYRKAE
jgi:hypothetical protein